ncbi:hypothetical protein TRIP_C60047 [Candidatus Zixiibacteriota bacterium]|nr:hypothetical protein TRIP_C60047 [candidate division Zixibacteria bacterium]
MAWLSTLASTQNTWWKGDLTVKFLVCCLRTSHTESYSPEDARSLASTLRSHVLALATGRFDVETEVLLLDDNHQLTISEENLIDSVDGAVIEVSEEDKRMAYICGKVAAKTIPCLLLRSKRSQSLSAGIFVEAPSCLVIYESLKNAIEEREADNQLAVFWQAVVDCWERGTQWHEQLASLIWFGQHSRDVHVICPPSYDNLPSASRSSPNYIHLDKFGDKDAFLEVAMFLSRLYGIRVIPYTPNEFPARQHLRDDLIVIGGPGFGDENDGNVIAREIMQRVAIGVNYQESPPALSFAVGNIKRWLLSEFTESGELIADVGLFARFANPFNPERTIVLIQGVHTAGVLGAAQAFTDTQMALANMNTVHRLVGDNAKWSFVSLMRVELLADDVLIPLVDASYVIPL